MNTQLGGSFCNRLPWPKAKGEATEAARTFPGKPAKARPEGSVVGWQTRTARVLQSPDPIRGSAPTFGSLLVAAA